jgi:hypothetical protein
VGVAGGGTGHHPDSRPPLPAGRELLDLAVVEAGTGGTPVLHVDLGELAAVAEGGGQHPLEDGILDHRAVLSGGSTERDSFS